MFKDTLLSLAHNQKLQAFVMHNGVARSVARRFVAGEVLQDAIKVTHVLNEQGCQVALDYLGENVTDEKEARATAQDYIRALDLIKQTGLDANISIKLTALGLDISRAVCEENLQAILQKAGQYGIFVCIDMEGSAYTERTVDITLRMHQQFEHVGAVIQAYLCRSKKDLEQLMVQGIRVRLVKGAYKEPANIAYQKKDEVDLRYIQLMKMLLVGGNFPAIATHDETMIDATCAFARRQGISRDAFEFQMLYGIRRHLQQKLVQRGYHMRVYVPYGSQWYPYLMRRMAERPANLIFVLSNALRLN
ncbi:MAG: proline dehydrogenase [Chloroflexi bacterium]|nr:MAG: proline dehydrogenase [Chloroflexota bacterium]